VQNKKDKGLTPYPFVLFSKNSWIVFIIQTIPEEKHPSSKSINAKDSKPIVLVMESEPSPNLIDKKETNGPIQVGKHIKHVNSLYKL
tara:strand:- start:82 stop:342 length:261 start_codon:yes stop_codon:yes gene_type:complete